MSDLSDWDSIKTTAPATPVATTSNTADWDAVPSKSGLMTDAEYEQHVKDTPGMARIEVRGLAGQHAPTATSADIPNEIGSTAQSRAPSGSPTEPTWADRLLGGGEAALTAVTGATTGTVGMLAGGAAGALGNLTGGRIGMKDGVEEGMRQGQESLTYAPRTETGQEYAGALGNAMASALPAMPLTAEMGAIGRSIKAPASLAKSIASEQLEKSFLDKLPGVADRSEPNLVGGAAPLQEAQKPSAIDQMKQMFADKTMPISDRVEPSSAKPRIKLNVDGSQSNVADNAPVPGAAPARISGLQSLGAAAAVNIDPFDAPSIAAKDAAHETAQSNGSDIRVDAAARAQTLQDIGLKTARQSALDANGKNAASDYHVGKYDEPAGVTAKVQFADERAAMQAHAEGIVADTGSVGGLDQDGRIASGRPVLEALDGLKQWFGSGWRDLYKRADAQAAGVPIDMPNTHAFIGGDKADFLGTTEGESLLRGATARMKSLGMIDADGNAQGVTVKQAEQLKQYLGNQWQPRTSRLIKGMKDAIDDDVIKTGGENGDIYRDARNMRRMQAETIDNPDGIAKIMDSSGPDGINRRVPIEDVTRTIASMPDAQFMHVIKTLGAMPEDLRGLGSAAIAEIKGHFANKLLNAGSNTVGGKARETWENTPVNAFIDNNSSRIQSLFNSDEIQKISTLRDAGNILSVDKAYPGSSAQAANAMKRGMMSRYIGSAATGAGAGLGAWAGLPTIGAMGGKILGDSVSSRMGEGAALKNFQKRTVSLSDFPK